MWAQTNVNDLLEGSDRAAPGSGAGTPAPEAAPVMAPVASAPTNAPRTAADMAQAGRVNPDTSWAWVLARPGAIDEGHVLLAVDGPSRAIVVVAWNASGRVTTFGASPDPRGQASGDLASRMAAKPGKDPAPDGRYWGVWSTTPETESSEAQRGSSVWAGPNSSLRAAIAGERTRARPLAIPGARAVLVLFPLPPGMMVDRWDVEAGSEAQAALQKPLAYMADGASPIPFSPLAGRPAGWDAIGAPGEWGFYKGSDNRGWLFTVLDL